MKNIHIPLTILACSIACSCKSYPIHICKCSGHGRDTAYEMGYASSKDTITQAACDTIRVQYKETTCTLGVGYKGIPM